MLRLLTLLITAAPLCCRNLALPERSAGTSSTSCMEETAFPDAVPGAVLGAVPGAVPEAADEVRDEVPFVHALRYRGRVAAGVIADEWFATSTDSGWNLRVVPRSLRTPWDCWFGGARKSVSRDHYQFVLVRWRGLAVLELQTGILLGGHDASGDRRRGLRPWRAACFRSGSSCARVEQGDLVLSSAHGQTDRGDGPAID